MRRAHFLVPLGIFVFIGALPPECEDPPGQPGQGSGVCVYIEDPNRGDNQQCGGSSGGGGPAPTPTPPPSPLGPRQDASYIPHTPYPIPVMLTNSVRNWNSGWVTHYNNARGWWNVTLNRAVWHDVSPNSPANEASVWIVRPGSSDENNINDQLAVQGISFEPYATCDDNPTLPSAWAQMHSAHWVNWDNHWHRAYQKICLRFAPDQYNQQNPPYHYWWLTLTHEMGHVLSLDDNPNGCLMRSGLSMLYPCAFEWNFVKAHYGL